MTEAAATPLDKRGTLRRLAVRGSALELGGYAASQVLRLASNLILSRLLFPEAFGLAALVTIFNQGLVMLSDVGIEQSVVQNDRGDESEFLNTAWSLHVSRGLLLWLMACVLAWPIASVYEEPELHLLLPVGAASVLIAGFASTSLFTLRRRLAVARLVAIEITAQVVGLMVVIPWAYFWPSVWAIVAGGLANALTKTVISHFMDVGYKNRFAWDAKARTAIMHFGKWIFGSSALSFLSRQGDRLLLGKYLGIGPLGVYSIAVFLSEALGTAVKRVTHGVFYPVFSQVRREEPERMREVYYKTRLRLDALSLVPLGGLFILGNWVVHFMYDSRYAAAGWMVEALSVRVAMSCMLTPCETCLFSMGHTRYGFLQNFGRSLWIVIGIPLAFHKWGIEGVVWTTALSEIPVLVILWQPFARFKLLRLEREALAVAFFGVGAILGLGADFLLSLMFV